MHPHANTPQHPMEVRRYDTLEQLTDNYFYIPISSNQSTFDSFYHFAGHVCKFQCVTGAQHTVNKKGLDMMQRLGVRKVTYIGLVPVGQEPEFVIDKSTADTYKNLLHARYLLQIGSDCLHPRQPAYLRPKRPSVCFGRSSRSG
jgi:hypothetical protein